MREAFQAQLNQLLADLAATARRSSASISTATTALQQSDLTLAGQVVAATEQNHTVLADIDQRCARLLALQTPVAADLRVVLSVLHAVHDLVRMSELSDHIAKLVWLKHPASAVPTDVQPALRRMSWLAADLATRAADAIDNRDPTSADRLAAMDDEVDSLRRELLRTLFSPHWSHGVEPAVDTALVGRYYERFADHAVALAQQVYYLVTGYVID